MRAHVTRFASSVKGSLLCLKGEEPCHVLSSCLENILKVLHKFVFISSLSSSLSLVWYRYDWFNGFNLFEKYIINAEAHRDCKDESGRVNQILHPKKHICLLSWLHNGTKS